MAQTKLLKLMDELEEVQGEIEGVKGELANLEDKEKELYEQIMPAMLKQGLEMARTTSGLTYYINKGRVTYAIQKFPGMKEAAVKWALENFPTILTVGAGDLKKVVEPMLEMPEFVEKKVGDPFLAVRN